MIEQIMRSRRWNMANKLIPNELRDGKILDVGCGKYPYFLERVEFKERIGIDPASKYSMKDITVHRDRIPDIWWSWKPNSFDVITMLAVLEHIEVCEMPDTFREIYRILKPGGRFILTLPHPRVALLLEILGYDRVHKVYYKMDTIEHCLNVIGFKEIKYGCFELGLNQWLIVKKEK